MPAQPAYDYNFVSANLYRLPVPRPWAGRAKRVINLIDSAKPHAVLFQECPEREGQIAAGLTGSWKQASDKVNCPIIVDTARFTVLDHIPIVMTGRERKRYGSAALLEDKINLRKIVLATLHPSSRKEKGYAVDGPKEVGQAFEQLDKWGALVFPLFIAGDMNDARPSSDRTGIAYVMKQHGLTDALDVLKTNAQYKNRAYSSSSDWKVTPPKTGRFIDRGYASKDWTFLHAENIFTGTAADHGFQHYSVRLEGPPVVVPQWSPDMVRILKDLGPINKMAVNRIDKAIKGAYRSRYIAALQMWLQRPELDGIWTIDDQVVLEAFRTEAGIPNGGSPGKQTLNALLTRAMRLNLPTWPVTD